MVEKKDLRLLIVEDSEDDSVLVCEILRKEGYVIHPQRVQTEESMKKMLQKESWDLIISDYSMPSFSGLDAIDVLKKSGIAIPLIIISGTVGENIAVETVKEGANDYVMKHNLVRLPVAVKQVLHEHAEQQELLETQNLFKHLFNSLSDPVVIVDEQGVFMEVSEKVCTITGFSREELLGKRFSDLSIVTPQSKALINEKLMSMKGQPYEIEVITRDGKTMLFESNPRKIDYKGKPAEMVVFRDISVRKEIENSIKSERTKLQVILDSMASGLVVVGKDKKIKQINKTALDLIGYSSLKDVVGKLCTDIFCPAKADCCPIFDEKKDVDRSEKTLLTKSGETIPIFKSALTINLDGEDVLLETFIDLTKQKEAESALLEQEEQFRLAFEQAKDAIFWADSRDGIIINCNVAAEQLLGRSREEILNQPLTILFSPDESAYYTEMFNRHIREKGAVDDEAEILMKSGEKVPVRISASLTSIGDEMIVQGIFRDISEQKRINMELEQSEERFSLAMKGANDGLWDWDLVTNDVYFSPRWKSMIGYKENELRDTFESWERLLHPDDVEFAKQSIEKYLSGKQKKFEIEFRMKHKKGYWVTILSRAFAVRNEENVPVRFVGTHTDVSEIKKYQEILNARERFLNAIIENIPDMIFVKDAADLRFVRFNKAGEDLLGFSRKDLLGKNDYDLFEKEQADFFAGKDREVLSSGKILDIPEEKIKTKIKGERILHTKKIPILNEAGNPVYLLGISEDITERKKIERRIQEAKEDWENTFDTINDAITILDVDFTILRLNKAAARLLGAQINEVLGSKFFMHYHGTSKPSTEYPASKALRTGKTEIYEIFEPHLGKYIEIKALPRFDNEKKIIGLVHVVRDITEKKKAEEKIFELSKFPSENPYPVMRFSSEAELLFANQPGNDLFRSWNNSVPEIICSAITEANEAQAARIVEIESGILTYSCTIAPVPEVGYVNLYALDITELKRLNALKDEFVSTVSHELRTPLTVIKEGILQFIEGLVGDVGEQQLKYLNIIFEAIIRLSRIIDDLLDISKIEAKRVKLLVKTTDMHELIRRVAKFFQKRVEAKGLSLHVKLCKTPVQVPLDPDRITQVFYNLIENAVKFTKKGFIVIELLNNSNTVECIVRDTGKGILKKDQKNLFNKFQQFGREHGPGIKGTGLGLAICKGLVESHGGTLWVESRYNKGTAFHFTIPKN